MCRLVHVLDRIDLHIEVPAVPFQELSAADGTPSAVMREQVSRARKVQQQRFGADSNVLNSRMSSRQLLPAGAGGTRPAEDGDGRAGPVGAGA